MEVMNVTNHQTKINLSVYIHLIKSDHFFNVPLLADQNSNTRRLAIGVKEETQDSQHYKAPQGFFKANETNY